MESATYVHFEQVGIGMKLLCFIIYFLKSFLFGATVNLLFLLLSTVYFLGGKRN